MVKPLIESDCVIEVTEDQQLHQPVAKCKQNLMWVLCIFTICFIKLHAKYEDLYAYDTNLRKHDDFA